MKTKLEDYVFAHNTQEKIYITVTAETENEAWIMLASFISESTDNFFIIDVRDSMYNDEIFQD